LELRTSFKTMPLVLLGPAKQNGFA
jgi:hypothetical protein